MKLSQVCALALLIVVGSAVAFADGINDPTIIIHGAAGGSSPCGVHQCQDVGINFSFSIPKTGKGTLYFTNVSGKNWTSLALVENGVPAADISCIRALPGSACSTERVAQIA